MIPCDVHRDQLIASYRKRDFMKWTHTLLQVSEGLHTPSPSHPPCSVLQMRLDLLDLLHDLFPNSWFDTDLEKMDVSFWHLDAIQEEDVERLCQQHHASGLWALYKEHLMPRVYRLVQAQWPRRPTQVEAFQRVGSLLYASLLYSHAWPEAYTQPPVDCAICLEKCFVQRMTTACRHTFHPECLMTWLQKQDTCPCCRAEVIRE